MRPPLRLGALDASHRPRVAEILRATKVFRDEEVEVALELFDEALLGAPSYRFLGAFHSDTLVGFSCHGPTPGTDRTFDLYWIAVAPALQGGGGGTALLAEVERALAADGARMLVVETSSRPEYAATRDFYARRGYAEAARVRGFYAPDDDRVIFTKRLFARRGRGAVAS